jgi:hypothetical protein
VRLASCGECTVAPRDLIKADQSTVDPHRAPQTGVIKLLIARRGSWRASQTGDHPSCVGRTSNRNFASAAAAHS